MQTWKKTEEEYESVGASWKVCKTPESESENANVSSGRQPYVLIHAWKVGDKKGAFNYLQSTEDLKTKTTS